MTNCNCTDYPQCGCDAGNDDIYCGWSYHCILKRHHKGECKITAYPRKVIVQESEQQLEQKIKELEANYKSELVMTNFLSQNITRIILENQKLKAVIDEIRNLESIGWYEYEAEIKQIISKLEAQK